MVGSPQSYAFLLVMENDTSLATLAGSILSGAHTAKQARNRTQEFLQLQSDGQFAVWGYGTLRWMLKKSTIAISLYTP